MGILGKYDSVDFFKGVCCIACVFIHYNFPGEFGIAVKTICRIAVPFFFFVSGYFFLNEDNIITKQRLKSKISHILRMLFYSGAFYAAFCVIFYKIISKNWTISNFVAQRIDLGSITKFFITNDPFVYAHLWFLLALLYCYLLMIPFRNKVFRKSKLFIYLFIMLLMGFSLFAEYRSLFGISCAIKLWDTKRYLMIFNLFVFRALPFFLMGLTFNLFRKEICEQKYNVKNFYLVFAIGSIMSLVERAFFVESQFYIGTYFVVMAMGIMAIQYPFLHNTVLNFIGKELSLYVYIFHIAVGKSLDIIANKFHLWNSVTFKYSRAFIVLFITLVISWMICEYKGNRLKSILRH